MFRGRVVAILLLLLVAGGVLAYFLSRVEEGDLGAYQRLLERSQQEGVQKFEATAQEREQVVKDLWITEGPDRLHTRLCSERSQLLVSYGDQPSAVEQMEGVTGVMQEALYYRLPDGRRASQAEAGLYQIEGEGPLCPLGEGWTAMQEIRYLRANQATYDYRTRRFAAEEVSMVRFEVEGHELIESFDEAALLLTATAQTVAFTLGGKQPDFRAYTVRAKIFAHGTIL